MECDILYNFSNLAITCLHLVEDGVLPKAVDDIAVLIMCPAAYIKSAFFHIFKIPSTYQCSEPFHTFLPRQRLR